jgi:hypothetical protein
MENNEKETNLEKETQSHEDVKEEKKQNFFVNFYMKVCAKIGKRTTIIVGIAIVVVLLALIILIPTLASKSNSTKNGSTTHTHSFTNYVYNNDATESENGTKTAKCDGCDKTDTKTAENTFLGTSALTYTTNTDGNYIVTGLESNFTGVNVYIPATYNGKDVVGISDYNEQTAPVFEENEKIEKVVIGKNVKTIGKDAFCCSSLKEITLPDGLTTIDDDAFSYCSNLKEVTLPNSLTTIGDNAFDSCTSLKEISIPDSVTSIGIEAFEGCSELRKVKLSNSLTEISENMFVWCYRLYEITIPDSVTTISKGAFNNSGLMSITIPKNVTSIGDYAFNYCPKLVEVKNNSSLTITRNSSENGCVGKYAEREINFSGDSNLVNVDGYYFFTTNDKNYLMGYVGDSTELLLPEKYNGASYELWTDVFHGYKEITKVVIPNTIYTITENAFESCESLVDITIGSGVTTIDNYAFDSCSSLETITIPIQVTTIAPAVSGVSCRIFAYCKKLLTINCEAASKPDGWNSRWLELSTFDSTNQYYNAEATINWGYTGN